MIKSLLGTHNLLIIEQILSNFRIYIDTLYQASLYGGYTQNKYGIPCTPPAYPYFFYRKKLNFIFSYRALNSLQNEPMTTYLGFLFFGRRQSKERGRDFRKFLEKIDEIQKLSIFTKSIRANFKAFFRSFLIKKSNLS